MTDEPILSVQWKDEELIILDQTKLPNRIEYIHAKDYKNVCDAIKCLAVRGAPAIGVAAGYAVVLAIKETLENISDEDEKEFKTVIFQICDVIKNARPTAVNLSWAVSELEKVIQISSLDQVYENALCKAIAIHEQDKKICDDIASHGASIFEGKKNLTILTHCNTGALATSGVGTALGVIKRLYDLGQVECLYMDETRPLLQGARLTAFEAMKAHIPCKLISDNMAALVMATKKVDAVIVGADRIALNGDGANKIGTYGLAILAHYHKVPFYLAAPFSTFDFTIQSGKEIPIEERNPDEVRKISTVYTAPENVPVFNPAFDVVPHSLITGIITEKGVITAPFDKNIKAYERSLIND